MLYFLTKKGCCKMGRWDAYLKLLIWESPQDFVTWLLPEARYIGRREGQFQTQHVPIEAFSTREIRADGMLEVEYAEQVVLLNTEFQSTKDEKIGERLLGYSYEATRLYELPVLSWVIYPRHVFEPPLAPYEWHVRAKGKILSFVYDSIELDELPLAALEQTQLIGLAPLWLCTQGGATREVLERAIRQLELARRPEALAILQLIATLVFEHRSDDLAWIQWRFATMSDFLLENSIVYKQLVREGELKGLKEGELKGLKEGELKGLEKGRTAGIRQSVEAVVQTRFPALLDLARERMEGIKNPDALQKLLVAMVAVSTESNARHYLLSLNEN
jgi:predicted transposase YdaD